MTTNGISSTAHTQPVNPDTRRALFDAAPPLHPRQQPEPSASSVTPRRSPPISPWGAAIRRLQERWNRLKASTEAREVSGHYIDLRETLDDKGSQPLRGVRSTLIAAFTDPVKRITKYINANRITVQRDTALPLNPSIEKTYVVGKSPVTIDDYHAVLLNAIESGQGLFQFVPRQKSWTVNDEATGANAADNTPSVLGKLRHDFTQARQSGQPLTIGKYTVTDVMEHESSPIPQDPTEKPNFYQRYQLDVQWRDDEGKICETSVPISQVGLRFTGQVLRQEELEQAQEVFSDHIAQIRAPHDPNIFSPGGIGRSATLMVHHEISQRIHDGLIVDKEALDAQIDQVINQGRRDRNPDFVHSPAQLDVLSETLLTLLKSKRPSQREANPVVTTALQPPATAEIDTPIVAAAPIQTAAAGPVAPANAIPSTAEERRLARDNTVDELVTVLGLAAIETLAQIDQLKAQYGAFHPEYVKEKLPFEIRIGELMRLQQVLLDMKARPLPDEAQSSQRGNELREALNTVLDIQDVQKRRADANKLRQDDSQPCTRDAIIEATFAATKKLFELPQITEKIGLVVNGGADTNTRYDERNNCLFVSILQHATGNHHDVFHRDMAKILREGLVAHTTAIRGEFGTKHAAALEAELHILEYTMQTVNSLFGRNLELRLMTPGFGDNAKDTVTMLIQPDEKTTATDVEPILVLQNNFHFQAIAPAAVTARLPDQEPLELPEHRAVLEQKQINGALFDRGDLRKVHIHALARKLQTEADKITEQIMAISKEPIDPVPLSPAIIDCFQNMALDSLHVLNEIHRNHGEKLRDEKIAHAAKVFNDDRSALVGDYGDIIEREVSEVDPLAHKRIPANSGGFLGMLVA